MITQIVEALQGHDELRFTPAFMYVPCKVALVMLTIPLASIVSFRL